MLWALNSHAVHELLVVQRGWTPSGTGIWLTLPKRSCLTGRSRHHDRMSNPYETGRPADVTGLDQVESNADAARIVEEMLHDLQCHPTEWENGTLERFLEALSASLDSLPNSYANRGVQFPNPPTWKLFAELLVMASGYE